jgi:hypothetical protein
VALPDYALEHFYYGQLIVGGKPQGEQQLLACTSGITGAHVTEALQEARIPPHPDTPEGSWALVRGKTIPFFLVQAQLVDGGQPMRHYFLPPVDVLRSLGGNLTALRSLVQAKLPTFEKAGELLPFATLPQKGIPSAEQQTEALLSLMSAARDRPNVIEALLAALVQNVVIIIKDAPPNLAARVRFVEGLMALLPPPARYGVTFATHTTAAVSLDAQIRFFNEDEPPPNALVYHWGASDVEGNKVKDEYSRFIKSQLWLDTSLVIQQTNALTAVAAWRIRQGDKLSDALKYASYRLKIDDALASGLPVESADVAKILAEDNTLSEELRALYVKHLMAFALAIDDAGQADLLATVVRGQPDLERIILSQMGDALAVGKADRVYNRLTRWMNSPLGFRGMFWIELLHRAALAYADMLVRNKDVEGLNRLLQHVRTLSPDVQIDAIIPQLIQAALPLRGQSQALSLTIFALAAQSLTTERWQKFLSLRQALPLPRPLQHLLAYLNASPTDTDPVPSGLLSKVVAGFTEEWRPLMYIRLSEAAILFGRFSLLDEPTLGGLAEAAITSWGDQHDSALRWIVRNVSVDELLPTLGTEGGRHILRILLARRAYEDLASELLRQVRILYPAEKQLDFASMVLRLFTETPFPLEHVPSALKILSGKGVKPLPLAMAYFGSLDQHDWSTALNGVVAELAALVISNPLIIEAIQPELLLKLLNYYAQVRDTGPVNRLLMVLAVTAGQRGAAGIQAMLRMYEMLDWSEDVRQAAMEGLRHFVRRSPDSTARQAVHKLGVELGKEVRRNLEATYLLQRLMGGMVLPDFAETLHIAADFLYDTAVTFIDKNKLPTLTMLVNDLDSLNGGLAAEDRAALSESILEFGRLIALLAGRHRSVRSRESDEQIEALLTGQGNAQSVLDVFRIMGGYLAQGRRVGIKTDKSTEGHPLNERAAHLLLRDLQQMNRMLRTAIRAFPANEKIAIGADVIRAETESLWGEMTLADRRATVRDLAIDLQRVADLAMLVTDRGDGKVLQEDSALGKRLDMLRQRPESTLEFYRLMHGYFKLKSRGEQ